MKITTVLSLLALLSVPVVAQEQPIFDDYQLLLVPVFSFGPGAHGSQWETRASLASATHDATMPVSLLADDPADCGSPDGVISHREVRSICSAFASPSGLFLYVRKGFAVEELNATSHVRDLSRQASSAGTEIPVVHESEFRQRDILLLDIPSDARFRTNLRIYAGPAVNVVGQSFFDSSPQRVTVDIFDSRAIDVFPALASVYLELSVPEVGIGTPYHVRPGYASIGDLLATFPQLASVPSYTIRVRTHYLITSPPVDLKSWAFATITNNDTQEVTTVTP
jgi:hypothetical protein